MPALYTRKTHLDNATLSLLGTSYYKTFKNFHINFSGTEQSGRAVAERYEQAVTTKRKFTFGGSIMRTASSVRQSMLGLTLFDFGSNALLGRLRSGSMSGQVILDEGSAGNDGWEYPFAVGTDISVSASLQIASTAAMMTLLNNATLANKLLTLKMTTPGFACWLPVNLVSGTQGLDPTKIQTEDLQFKLNGDTAGIIAANISGDALLMSAISGTAAGAFSFDTGANTYTAVDGCVISDFGFNFDNGQIIDDNFNFQACGPVTIT